MYTEVSILRQCLTFATLLKGETVHVQRIELKYIGNW